MTEEKNEGQSSAVSMGQAFAECFKQALQVTRPQSTATSSGHAQEKKPQLALCDIPERQREDLLSQGNKLPEKQKDTVSDVVRNTEPISKDVDTDGFPTVPVQGAAKMQSLFGGVCDGSPWTREPGHMRKGRQCCIVVFEAGIFEAGPLSG